MLNNNSDVIIELVNRIVDTQKLPNKLVVKDNIINIIGEPNSESYRSLRIIRCAIDAFANFTNYSVRLERSNHARSN